MTNEISIHNYFGRDILIPYSIGNGEFTNINLKMGLNIIAGEIWDKIRNHPAINSLLNQPHISCLMREKKLMDNEKDSEVITKTGSYNTDDKKHMMLEVIDYRSSIAAVKAKKEIKSELKSDILNKEM
jgi:hypothetical protein